ncbi:MAG: hypothetical protein II943_02715 [Victivallales bacterium]|nr:hypothetical protein [Victivallales bacterium]
MNFILKIIQGPNAGAEIALVADTAVSFGRDESCDIVLGDQALPEKAGELVVAENQVSLRRPDGSTEQLIPLHVMVMENTAFAVGPGDTSWGALVWPEPDAKAKEPASAPEEAKTVEESMEKPVKPRGTRLQWTLLVLLVLVVLLEFAIWFFWPTLSLKMLEARVWWQEKSAKWFADKRELAARPIHSQTLNELAMAFGVEAVMPPDGSAEPPVLRGNLRRRADRLELTAMAYNSFPGIELELSDDESLRNSSEELLHMVTEDKVKVVEAANRHLALAGTLDGPVALRRMLEAIQADVPFAESVDCSQVTLPVVAAAATPAVPVEITTPVSESEPVVASAPVAPVLPKLPVVGVLMTPYPCLVMRDGSRVVEGTDFHGFIVSKITADTVVLRQGDITLEWKP